MAQATSKNKQTPKRGSPRNTDRSYGAIILAIGVISILLLSGLAMILGTFPGVQKEDKAEYDVKAFFYNTNHTAEKGGHSDYIMYVKNTGNRKDTYELSVPNNPGRFDIHIWLFSLESNEFAQYLVPGQANEKVIEEFDDKGIVLNSESTVTEISDTEWTIEDGQRSYLVQKNLGLFNFFGYEWGQITLNKRESRAIILSVDVHPSASGAKYAEIKAESPAHRESSTRVRFNVQVVDDQGDAITEDDKVGMWYLGTLVDGTMFDSNMEEPVTDTSIPRKKSMTEHFDIFDLSPNVGEAGVIDGWNQGIPGMKLGETRVLRIPAKMAYQDSGELAHETLLFEITLGEIY